MDTSTISKVITILRKEVKQWQVPIITLIAQMGKGPFRVLIATVLSLRTKDDVTAEAARKLFAKADSPEQMIKLTEKDIQKLIYPVGFYKVKAKNIKLICEKLVKEYDSKVPEEIDELLKFPNVGRKTANLVVSDGFGKPAVCIDIHNFRILNRFGYVNTQTPYETELEIRKKLPKKNWSELNYILVAFGQHLCRPTSPWCSKCPVVKYCERVNVEKSR
ncbi:MAG: endonuclease III [Nanoarchaeota archaeon]|nr:endonuclease III [Nanoarchaeota archaeon]